MSQFVDRAFPIIQSEPSLQSKPTSDSGGGDDTSVLDQLHAKATNTSDPPSFASVFGAALNRGAAPTSTSDNVSAAKSDALRQALSEPPNSDSASTTVVNPTIASPPIAIPDAANPPAVVPAATPEAADPTGEGAALPDPLAVVASPVLSGNALKAQIWRLFHGATGVRDLKSRLAPLHLNSNFVNRLLAAKRLPSFVPTATEKLISSIGSMHSMPSGSLSLAEAHPNVFGALMRLHGKN